MSLVHLIKFYPCRYLSPCLWYLYRLECTLPPSSCRISSGPVLCCSLEGERQRSYTLSSSSSSHSCWCSLVLMLCESGSNTAKHPPSQSVCSVNPTSTVRTVGIRDAKALLRSTDVVPLLHHHVFCFLQTSSCV